MKCDKFTTPIKIEIPGIGTIESKDLLLKVEVDEAIAELKDRIHDLENMPHTDNSAVIELLENQNAELREATRWRKYPEEKPDDGQVVWAYEADSNRVLILEYEKTDEGEGFICFPYKQDFYRGITHWMPYNKPKAPEVK